MIDFNNPLGNPWHNPSGFIMQRKGVSEMGKFEAFRKDVAAFFDFLLEKCLAKDTYEEGKIRVTGERWALRNIAEVLSTEDVICEFIETDDHCELSVKAA